MFKAITPLKEGKPQGLLYINPTAIAWVQPSAEINVGCLIRMVTGETYAVTETAEAILGDSLPAQPAAQSEPSDGTSSEETN